MLYNEVTLQFTVYSLHNTLIPVFIFQERQHALAKTCRYSNFKFNTGIRKINISVHYSQTRL